MENQGRPNKRRKLRHDADDDDAPTGEVAAEISAHSAAQHEISKRISSPTLSSIWTPEETGITRDRAHATLPFRRSSEVIHKQSHGLGDA